MQRVKRSTAVAVLPAAPAGGTPGYFSDPNPQGGVPATVPGYEWYNHVQEEIVALIAAAGLTLDDANNAQMLEAVQRLIDAQSGNYALDTGVANAYVVALNPAIAAYTDGLTVRLKIVNANTAASTLNAGGGVVPLVNDVGGALVAGDLPAGGIVTATYIASAGEFYVTSTVQSQGDARYILQSNEVTAASDPTGVDNSTKVASSGWIRNAMANIATAAGFAASFSSNGYVKFPSWLGGWIINWGFFAGNATSGGAVSVTFPLAFTTSMNSLVLGAAAAQTTIASAWSEAQTLNGFTGHANVANNANYFAAIGK
ncbi:MAG: gp53-like domain-containing protein [Sulfuriferula sp.]